MVTEQEVKNKLIRTNNNMDVVRYFLAMTVLVSHYNDLAGTSFPLPLINVNVAVASFFTLSGFLMFDSYHKHPRLKKYLELRARRILPPYFFIVIVCAIGLSAISTLSVAEYFTSGQWWKYLIANLSFMNFIQPDLPGVFQGGQMMTASVNGSLWTMKVEWFLYLSVPVVSWIIYRIHKLARARDAVIWTIIILSIAYRIGFNYLYETTGRNIFDILSRQFCGQLSFFYVGALIRLYLRQFLSYSKSIAAGIVVLWSIIYLIPDSYLLLSPFVFSALVMWVSMIGNWGGRISRHDNVSYDMYLFHYPIIQLAVWYGVREWNPWAGLATVTIITVAASFMSWNLVGRRFVPSGKRP
ncbi:MAG: acyltransferase [Muribaculaceae bacterium]|nr:acyltransferase [Muribaculaceae bacterium]